MLAWTTSPAEIHEGGRGQRPHLQQELGVVAASSSSYGTQPAAVAGGRSCGGSSSTSIRGRQNTMSSSSCLPAAIRKPRQALPPAEATRLHRQQRCGLWPWLAVEDGLEKGWRSTTGRKWGRTMRRRTGRSGREQRGSPDLPDSYAARVTREALIRRFHSMETLWEEE